MDELDYRRHELLVLDYPFPRAAVCHLVHTREATTPWRERGGCVSAGGEDGEGGGGPPTMPDASLLAKTGDS
jgi:hypothetical protein